MPEKLPRIQIQIELAELMKAALAAYEALDTRVGGPTPFPPTDIARFYQLRDFFDKVAKHAHRVCWDARAFCRFREGVCCLAPEETADREKLVACRWRGKVIG